VVTEDGAGAGGQRHLLDELDARDVGGSWEKARDKAHRPEGIDEAFNMAIGLSESLTDFLSMQGDSVGIASKTFVAVPALPPNPTPGTIYIVPGADGVLTLHLPIPMQ
ncbi:hypothetical protein GS441_21050, partial [Rhodococcus hoagii]|nr:hypothetical protein [Prescottella equi]